MSPPDSFVEASKPVVGIFGGGASKEVRNEVIGVDIWSMSVLIRKNTGDLTCTCAKQRAREDTVKS